MGHRHSGNGRSGPPGRGWRPVSAVAIVTTLFLLLVTACASPAADGPGPEATSAPSTLSTSRPSDASPAEQASSPATPDEGSATPDRTPAGEDQTSPRPTGASGDPKPGSTPSESIRHVVAISVDGLNPRALTVLGPSGAPTFHRLMREGASTLDARTEREQTRTLPNHTGMLTGRRIDDRLGGHGVTFNQDAPGRTVHRAAGEYVSSVFDVVHDHGGTTALFATKTKFALFERTWDTDGGPDRVGVDDGTDKIDEVVVDTDDGSMVAKLDTYLADRPGEFVFVHIALPDEAGHKDGFMSDSYLAAVRTTDELLGSVLDTISGRPALRRETVVLLTADHGGDGGSHSDQSKIANYQIPFMAWGPGVPAGRDLYSLNPDRRDPGTDRTTYEGPQPIRNGELANLATDVLRLPKVPGSEFDADQDLVIFGS